MLTKYEMKEINEQSYDLVSCQSTRLREPDNHPWYKYDQLQKRMLWQVKHYERFETNVQILASCTYGRNIRRYSVR